MEEMVMTQFGKFILQPGKVTRVLNNKVESAEFRESIAKYPQQVQDTLTDFSARLEQLEINLELIEEKLDKLSKNENE